jgi:hypothetical protein
LDQESLIFEEKETLYRNEATEITQENRENYFLLYVDDELDAATRSKVETYVLQHPETQDSFTQLKQTKLPLENIVFADKYVLYKKEEKVRPIFYLNFQRIAVAAAMIGLVVLLWNVVPRSSGDQQLVAKNTFTPGTQQNVQKNIGVETMKGNIIPLTINSTIRKNVSSAEVRNALASESVNPSSAAEEQNALTAANHIPLASEPVKRAEIFIQPADRSTHNNSLPNTNTTLNHSDIAMVQNTNELKSDESITQPTVYRELDTEDENKSLYLGAVEINKDKLRGFFRKAGSIFRGKAKPEDEKTENTNPGTTRALK